MDKIVILKNKAGKKGFKVLDDEHRERLAKSCSDFFVLDELARDDNRDVRWNVATNPYTTAKTLALLAKDPDNNVRLNVACNHNTSPLVLGELAKASVTTIRCGVALNPNTKASTLHRLATDTDFYVRYNALVNPNTGPNTLFIACNNEKHPTLIALARHHFAKKVK